MDGKWKELFLGGIGISTVIFGFMWTVGWDRILETMAYAEPGTLLLAGIITFSGMVVLGIGWWVLIKDTIGFNVLEGLEVFFTAQFANFLTPMGQFGGEPIITYILMKTTDVPVERSLAAVVAVDFVNTIPFFTVSLAGIFLYRTQYPGNPLISFLFLGLITLFTVFSLFFLLLWKRKETTLHALEHVGNGLHQLLTETGVSSSRILSVVNGDYFTVKGRGFYDVIQEVFENKKRVGQALILAHIADLMGVLGMYLFLHAFGVDAPLAALMFIMSAAGIPQFLPIPGGLGGVEVATATMLTSIAGVPTTIAVSAVLFFRLFSYWTTLLVGGYAASKLSLHIWTQITTAAKNTSIFSPR